MHTLTSDDIRRALSDVIDHDAGKSVVDAGMISGITIQGGRVGFIVTLAPDDAERKQYLREVCERAVRALPGVEAATAVLTAEAPRRAAVWNAEPVEGVKKIIAIGSGKGGVGKSTVAAGLAQALAASGKRAGLLDADIYGPSVPRMMGLLDKGKPELSGGKMLPYAAHGVQCMSVGFLLGAQAAVLRGPMISKTLTQLLRGTGWDALDILLIDLPPGTGDVQLSLAQAAPLSGALIVTTPQEVAVADARKAADMFSKVNVPVLGVVENMTGEAFGRGGGGVLAREIGAPLLAEIALDASIRMAADAGGRQDERIFAVLAGKLGKFG